LQLVIGSSSVDKNLKVRLTALEQSFKKPKHKLANFFAELAETHLTRVLQQCKHNLLPNVPSAGARRNKISQEPESKSEATMLSLCTIEWFRRAVDEVGVVTVHLSLFFSGAQGVLSHFLFDPSKGTTVAFEAADIWLI
jgi:hypothetical protein